ncbi:MAG: hypothetical protein GX359_10395 [Clostridiales bacterium]|jgi:hypothetical protein|nr:hypothetical protein [Clostridiales bacterium]
MSIKNLVKTILDIEVSTEDILKLHENPQKYTNSEEDAEKLKDLFLLMDLADRQEVDEDDNY